MSCGFFFRLFCSFRGVFGVSLWLPALRVAPPVWPVFFGRCAGLCFSLWACCLGFCAPLVFPSRRFGFCALCGCWWPVVGFCACAPAFVSLAGLRGAGGVLVGWPARFLRGPWCCRVGARCLSGSGFLARVPWLRPGRRLSRAWSAGLLARRCLLAAPPALTRSFVWPLLVRAFFRFRLAVGVVAGGRLLRALLRLCVGWRRVARRSWSFLSRRLARLAWLLPPVGLPGLGRGPGPLLRWRLAWVALFVCSGVGPARFRSPRRGGRGWPGLGRWLGVGFCRLGRVAGWVCLSLKKERELSWFLQSC